MNYVAKYGKKPHKNGVSITSESHALFLVNSRAQKTHRKVIKFSLFPHPLYIHSLFLSLKINFFIKNINQRNRMLTTFDIFITFALVLCIDDAHELRQKKNQKL